MAKSIRSKREKRLRAIRREIVQPIYDKKDEAKLSALEAALNAPKLDVNIRRKNNNKSSADMDTDNNNVATTSSLEMEMDDDNQSSKALKPIGRKMKKKIKIARRKHHGKGKVRKKNNV